MPAPDEDLFDSAVRKAIGNVLASMREARTENDREFATYKALRLGVASLEQFDDLDAVEFVITAATDMFGLSPDHAQHAAASGMLEGRQAREQREQEQRKNGNANGHANGHAIPLTFPFPIKGEDIPLRPWIVPGLLLRRHVTMLVAPPGSGKSLLTLQLAMICTAGQNEWAGWRPRGAFRAMVINSEEDDDEQRRRLFATAKHMAFNDPAMLAGFCFAKSPESIVIAKADSRTKTVTRTPMIEEIVATLIENHIDIVVVDPFAETFVGDENSNSELKWAAVLWREVARRTNAAVLLVHHARKYSGDMAGDMDAARGGGALVGVCRIVATLFAMTEDEAQRMKISNRERYLRFDDAKANLSLIGGARWFQKFSVSVPNGADGVPGDEVGVLSPWIPPSVFDNMNADQANAILNELAAGYFDDDGEPTGDPFAPSPARGAKPKRWAGYVIQRHLNCNEDDAKEILRVWVENGVLAVFQQAVRTGKKKAAGTPSDCLKINNSMRPGGRL